MDEDSQSFVLELFVRVHATTSPAAERYGDALFIIGWTISAICQFNSADDSSHATLSLLAFRIGRILLYSLCLVVCLRNPEKIREYYVVRVAELIELQNDNIKYRFR